MPTDVKQKPTYSISLWDSYDECDGTCLGWSESLLAGKILEGPSEKLSRAELATALRKLRQLGWGDSSIFVQRDG